MTEVLLGRELADARAAQREEAQALAAAREAAQGTAAQMAERQKKFMALNAAFRRKEAALQAEVEAAQAAAGQAAAVAAAARREAAAAREARARTHTCGLVTVKAPTALTYRTRVSSHVVQSCRTHGACLLQLKLGCALLVLHPLGSCMATLLLFCMHHKCCAVLQEADALRADTDRAAADLAAAQASREAAEAALSSSETARREAEAAAARGAADAAEARAAVAAAGDSEDALQRRVAAAVAAQRDELARREAEAEQRVQAVRPYWSPPCFLAGVPALSVCCCVSYSARRQC